MRAESKRSDVDCFKADIRAGQPLDWPRPRTTTLRSSRTARRARGEERSAKKRAVWHRSMTAGSVPAWERRSMSSGTSVTTARRSRHELTRTDGSSAQRAGSVSRPRTQTAGRDGATCVAASGSPSRNRAMVAPECRPTSSDRGDAQPPRVHDLHDRLCGLGSRLPLDGRAGVQQQPAHRNMVATGVR